MRSGKCLGHRALAPEGIGGFFLAPTSIQDELLLKKKKRSKSGSCVLWLLLYTIYSFLSHIHPSQWHLPCWEIARYFTSAPQRYCLQLHELNDHGSYTWSSLTTAIGGEQGWWLICVCPFEIIGPEAGEAAT